MSEIQLPDYLTGPIVIDLETKDEGLKFEVGPGWPWKGGHVLGVAIHSDNFHGYLAFGHVSENNISQDKACRWLREVLSKDNPKIFANAVYDLGWLTTLDVYPSGPFEDVQIQSPLLNEYRREHNIDALGMELFKTGKDYSELEEAVRIVAASEIGRKKKINYRAYLYLLPASKVEKYAMQDALLTRQIWDVLSVKIKEEELEKTYKLECELIPVLVAMKKRGIRVDLERAEIEAKAFLKREEDLLIEIKQETGVDVELTKSESKAKVLDFFNIKYPRTPKTDKASIKGDWLEEQAEIHKLPVLDKMVRAAKFQKTRRDFIESGIMGHQQNGRIYCSFNAMKGDSGGTVSGRFSSSDPNLQQIPNPEKDMEIGIPLRSLFLPEVGEKFMTADYSSQEPRWTAEWAYRCEKAGVRVRNGIMVADEYRKNPRLDFHQFTANLIHGREASKKERKDAKAINLGLAYGMGGGKLCLALGLPFSVVTKSNGETFLKSGAEGNALLEKYHERCPFIKDLTGVAKQTAMSQGFIRTVEGRKCRFPYVDGEYWYIHTALNRLIQGSSADQTKKAMVQLYNAGKLCLLSIHDELCGSVVDMEEALIYKHTMETAIETYVPFVCDPKLGNNWGECL